MGVGEGFRGGDLPGVTGEETPPGRRRGGHLVEVFGVFRVFTVIGAFSFGGPAATQGLVYMRVVDQLGWITEREFLGLMGVVNLLPGPNAVEMAMHIGRRRAGWGGFVAGGIAFILPGAMCAVLLAAAYVRYGDTPSAESVLYGVKPVVIAVTGWSVLRLAKGAKPSVLRVSVMVMALVAYLLGINETVVLATAGALMLILRRRSEHRSGRAPGAGLALIPFWPAELSARLAPRSDVPLDQVLAVFLKAGALMFGGGAVLFAVLRTEVVINQGWLSEAELLEAITIGQVTPGPILTTATFIGYLLAGGAGAAVATAAALVPSFVLMTLAGPLLRLIARSTAATAFLDGITLAAIGVVGAVTVDLAAGAIVDPLTTLVAVCTAAIMLWRPSLALLLLAAGSLVGLASGFLVL